MSTLKLLADAGPAVTIESQSNEQLRLVFPQSSANTVTVNNGNASLLIAPNVRVAVTQVDGGIDIVFSQPTVQSTGIILRLDNIGNFQGGGPSYSGSIGNTNINISLFHIFGSSASSNNLICFSLFSAEAKISIRPKISEALKFSMTEPENQVVSALSEPTYPIAINVLAGQRPPEFSLGIYDDANYTIPRPVRLGVPVVSTVPAEPISGASTLSGTDAATYASGLGTQYRTMYFRAVCNQILPVPSVQLMIYMPAGIDTISSPIEVTLYTSAWAGATNVLGRDFRGNSLLPSGNSIFQVENTITSVDGLCYFNVFLPIYCQVSLPIRLEITANGQPITNFQTFENPSLF